MDRLKSKTTIGKLFARYVFFLAAGTVMSLIGTVCIVIVCLEMKFILPANFSEKTLEYQRSRIENGADLKDIVPEGCYYGVYTKDGKFKNGNIKAKNQNQVWQDVKNKEYDTKNYFYKVFTQNQDVGIVLYKLKARFKAPWMNQYLPGVEMSFMMLFIILFVLMLIGSSKQFSKIIIKEMEGVSEATQKINLEQLDFEIKPSSIKEVNDVLESLMKLKGNLKQALYKEWEMEDLRKEQIAALGHDLKTPLTILKGNAELLMETTLTEEQIYYGDNILRKIEDLQAYIQILLEINYSENGLQAHFETVEVKDFIDEIKMDLKNQKQIQFEVEGDGIPKYMEVDLKLIKRAIMNIIMNAIEYTPEEKPIVISMIGVLGKLMFIVEDSGKGFSKEELSKVSEKFYRGDSSRSSNLHYGMGLYIAKKIAVRHGGDIAITNTEKLGGGKVSMCIKLKNR